MKRTATIFGAALVAVAMTSAMAHAQIPGKYVGRNSDGFSVDLDVYKTPAGALQLTVVRVSAFFYCNGKLVLSAGRKAAYGAAILMNEPIKDGVATFSGSSNRFSALSGTVQFNGDLATGFLVGYAPFFVGSKTPPTNAEALSCMTENLRFTAKPFNPID